jgi:hypothetical protein
MDYQQILLNYSNVSDLAGLSTYAREDWLQLREEHSKAARYFSGDIFRERVEVEVGEDDTPLLYPVGVNLVKLLVIAMTDATFGEFDGSDPVLFITRNNLSTSNEIRKTIDYLSSVMSASNAGSSFWELDFDRNLYGGSVLKVVPAFSTKPKIRWQKIPIDGFYPVFDPENPDELVECFYAIQMTEEQAKQVYGIEPKSQIVVKLEHWTKFIYETYVDGVKVSEYSGVNPWGVVPFVYIPRVRTLDLYGDGLAKDIYAPQDELNMRLADIGDTLSYHSHPIFYGINLPKSFTTKNFPIAANALWDLGRSFGTGNAEPKVDVLQSKTPVPPAAFEHIKFIYDWTRTAASAPPIAFGEDDGGGQRSGVTLEIRLWPLLKSVRRSRSYFSAGLMKAISITAKILEQKNFSDIPSYVHKTLSSGVIEPSYHRVLPKDQPAIVDEVVKLMSTTPPSISLETSQEILGRGASEITRIIGMMEQFPDIFSPKEKPKVEEDEDNLPD